MNSNRVCRYAASAIIFILAASTQLAYPQEPETATMIGRVLDENDEPIPGAIIGVVGPRNVRRRAAANSSGTFGLVFDTEGRYSIYAVCNRSETAGVDYVPALWRTYPKWPFQESVSSLEVQTPINIQGWPKRSH